MAEQQMCQPLYREFQSFRLFICTLIIIYFFSGLGTSRYERVVIGAWSWCGQNYFSLTFNLQED
jgi:hypothetical protein